MSVFGRKKWTLWRTFFVLRATDSFTALAVFEAFLAAFSALGAMSHCCFGFFL